MSSQIAIAKAYETAINRHCTQIADRVVPEYRSGRPKNCTSHYAKRWSAAYEGARMAFADTAPTAAGTEP